MIDSGAFQDTSGNAKHQKSLLQKGDTPVVSKAEYDALKREFEQFVYRVSHDLSAPLRHIEQFSALLINSLDEDLDQRQTGFKQHVSDAVDRCHRMLDGLLLLSRVDTAELARESVNLDALAEQVAKTRLHEVSDCRLEMRLKTGAFVQADSEQLNTLIKHLIDNAVRFRQQGSTLNIVVSSQVKNNSVLLSVEDNGIGIEEKYSEAIFDVFHQLGHKAKQHGDGIGLTLCRKIASRHGGTIYFKQAPLEGAIFTVSLPMSIEE